MSDSRQPEAADSSLSSPSLVRLSSVTSPSHANLISPFPPSPSRTQSAPFKDSHSAQSPSLFLPPELLREVFSAVPLHPSTERNKTLASLCLVSRTFRALARPLLYQDVLINLQSWNWLAESPANCPIKTLVEQEECASLVRSVGVHCAHWERKSIVMLAYVLAHVKNVDSVRTVHPEIVHDPEVVADFLLAVLRHCPKVRHLGPPLPLYRQDFDSQEALLSRFRYLTSFEGRLRNAPTPSVSQSGKSSPPPPPALHLDHLVLHFATDTRILTQILSASHETLKTLSFGFEGSLAGKFFDFSPLVNLSTLHVRISLTFDDEFFGIIDANEVLTSLGQPEEQSRLRKILETTRDLPITDFSFQVQVIDLDVRDARTDIIDALIFQARDPLRTIESALWPSYVCPLPSKTPRFPWPSLRREAFAIIKKSGFQAIRAVQDFGVTIECKRLLAERSDDGETPYPPSVVETEDESEEEDAGLEEVTEVEQTTRWKCPCSLLRVRLVLLLPLFVCLTSVSVRYFLSSR